MSSQAMVLAAGRGERMRPLTDTTPKPLLEVRGKPLMQWHLEALAAGGAREAVVNTAWLGEQIEARLGPSFAGLSLHYSHEGRDFGGALETAGGIARALPLLDDVFWVVAGDVHVPGFRFDEAIRQGFAAGKADAHLWLVSNPPHNPMGDFGLAPDGFATGSERTPHRGPEPGSMPPRHTFSTIALYRKRFFADLPTGNPDGRVVKLAPMLYAAIARRAVTAELYPGPWTDVGTPERLAALNA